jgi:hypothetical protein
MNRTAICFAIVSPCHAVITGSQEWDHRRQLHCEIVDDSRLPIEFKKVVPCGYRFNCDEQSARKLLAGLGFRESETLGESGILDDELIFGNEAGS